MFASALLATLVVSGADGQVAAFLATSPDLVVRDLVTLDSTTVGDTGAIGSSGLAMRHDGVLLSASHFTDDLWRIDPNTGAGVRIGPFGTDVHVGSGLTFDACGDLWMVSRNELYSVNPTTAETTFVAQLTSFDQEIVGLTARGERLLGLVAVGTPVQLGWIDPIEGTLDLFGEQIFLPTLQAGLDFDQEGGLWAFYWMDSPIPGPWSSSVVQYDPETGAILNVVDEVLPPYAGNLAISPPEGACNRGSPLEVPVADQAGLALLVVVLACLGVLYVQR